VLSQAERFLLSPPNTPPNDAIASSDLNQFFGCARICYHFRQVLGNSRNRRIDLTANEGFVASVIEREMLEENPLSRRVGSQSRLRAAPAGCRDSFTASSANTQRDSQ
jgi:hypothetical protein